MPATAAGTPPTTVTRLWPHRYPRRGVSTTRQCVPVSPPPTGGHTARVTLGLGSRRPERYPETGNTLEVASDA